MDNEKKKITFATTSPQRKDIINKLGLNCNYMSSNVDEYSCDRPNKPFELVSYLAKLKALSVSENISKGVVIGFDTIVVCDNYILEKPKSLEEAVERLKFLSGKNNTAVTGVFALDIDNGKEYCKVVTSEAVFKNLDDEDVSKYIRVSQKDSLKTPLGFVPSQLGDKIIESINDSFTNYYYGMPLECIFDILRETNILSHTAYNSLTEKLENMNFKN